MAANYSTTLRNAQLDAIETTLLTGGNPRLYLYTGAKPVSCASADPSGSVVVSGIDMGSNPFALAASGQIVLTAPIVGTASPGGTNIQSFRIKDGAGTCHIQGTVATSGADLNMNPNSLTNGQAITITSLTITSGNS